MAITRISNAAAIAAVNAVGTLLNSGGAGKIEIRTGTQPADVSIAATGTLLGTLTLSSTAFGSATDQNGYARAVANPITDDTSADAAGTAGWFRAYNGAGAAVLDGDIGITGGSESMLLDSVNIAQNDTIKVSIWYLIQSET